MNKYEFDRHKFDTRWKVLILLILLAFASFLQVTNAPMANEFVALIIGLMGGGAAAKQIV